MREVFLFSVCRGPFRAGIISLVDLHDKKVLVMGLGSLGGGVASAKWFLKHGAKVTVTDLRTKKDLAASLEALGEDAKKILFVLGEHRARDFETSDLIMVNPAVPRESKFLKIARRAGKEATNDARVFFDLAPNPVVAVTGTRGKTTTTNWIAHFLQGADRGVFAAGNTPDRPLLADLDRLAHRPETPAVVELSSWQIEFLAGARRAPNVAVITNLYPDHLNRYRGIEDYARAKANIFKNQNPAQALILNAENPWTPFFLRLKPKSRVYLVSAKLLPQNTRGLSIVKGALVFSEGGHIEPVAGAKLVRDFEKEWGTHNLENLLAAMLGARLAPAHQSMSGGGGLSWRAILARVSTLPRISFRQEIIVRRKRLMVVNDSAGTSPDATIAALARFKGPHTYLITGGTDKKLEFGNLAHTMKDSISPNCVFFLNGSATKRLLVELQKTGYFKKSAPQVFESLRDILHTIARQIQDTNYKLPATILFSPGAASFEKFKNEFDRGAQFTRAARRFLRLF